MLRGLLLSIMAEVHVCLIDGHGTRHVTTKQRCKYTALMDIQKRATKGHHSFRITCKKSAVILLESGEWCYIKVIINNIPYAKRLSSVYCIFALQQVELG